MPEGWQGPVFPEATQATFDLLAASRTPQAVFLAPAQPAVRAPIDRSVFEVFSILHLFSGERRRGDVQWFIEESNLEMRFYSVVRLESAYSSLPPWQGSQSPRIWEKPSAP